MDEITVSFKNEILSQKNKYYLIKTTYYLMSENDIINISRN